MHRYLTEHTTPETAYVVEDYPYGFRLRTKIRYWIETTKHGMRLVSQTLNPKTGAWNKPKPGGYTPLLVMVFDEQGHVRMDGFGDNSGDEAALDAFLGRYPRAFQTGRDKAVILRIHVWIRAQKRVTWTVGSDAGKGQAIEEQVRLLDRIAADEARKIRDG